MRRPTDQEGQRLQQMVRRGSTSSVPCWRVMGDHVDQSLLLGRARSVPRIPSSGMTRLSWKAPPRSGSSSV
ncbi:hypothetical protein [Streptomyces coffeae]|uniref:hypothetical protein n=1 Tax=Streptomyces coffeae TaxID=621382 RepID=UPI0027DDF917|nr:hypothetical protein [Streptomyces coffeae]